VPIVLKSGSLNLLEPLGPVKACNGIALLLRLSEKMVLGGTFVLRRVSDRRMGKIACEKYHYLQVLPNITRMNKKGIMRYVKDVAKSEESLKNVSWKTTDGRELRDK
jgi:hypothetical protein